MKIGIMGGTFDPIHNGHLAAAAEAQAALGLDHIIFVPAGNPVHKQTMQVTDAEHRYLMTVIATASNPAFSVSRVDVDRGGYTYTIDTLRDLQAQYPEDELYFITGADVIAEIFDWDRGERLFDVASFVGCTRPGYTIDEALIHRAPANRLYFVEASALAISSTALRARVREHRPLWYLVPDGVVQYVEKNELYV